MRAGTKSHKTKHAWLPWSRRSISTGGPRGARERRDDRVSTRPASPWEPPSVRRWPASASGMWIYLRTIATPPGEREMASLENAIVVVGGGLLACETAASLRHLKFKVSMMHRNAYLLNRYLDPKPAPGSRPISKNHGVACCWREPDWFSKAKPFCLISRPKRHRIAAGVAVVACGAEPNLEAGATTRLFPARTVRGERVSRDGRKRSTRSANSPLS